MKNQLICSGRGRIERFAVLAEYSERFEEKEKYSVLHQSQPITGDFTTIGYVTSVAESVKHGTTVAIAVLTKKLREKVLYRNLHWKHWRVATVQNLASDIAIF